VRYDVGADLARQGFLSHFHNFHHQISYFESCSLVNPTMKSYQILVLLTVGSCALITADTGVRRASAEVETAPVNAVQEIAPRDQNDKNRLLGGYGGTEDDGYGGDEKDYADYVYGGKGKCTCLFWG
jgi:hypothetical protein